MAVAPRTGDSVLSTTWRAVTVALALLSAVGGCGGDGGAGDAGESADTSVEAAEDARTDAAPDGDADSVSDADGDADADASTDAGGDADGDADADASTDADDGPGDAGDGGDASSDADGESGADASTGEDASADASTDAGDSTDADGVGADGGSDADVAACAHPVVGQSCADGWCTIPAGCFTMGSPPGELGREPLSARETQHEVTLTHDFEIGSTEVTQASFSALMGYNPAGFPDCGGDCPVESVTWHQAAAYCNALSSAAVLSPCYDCWGAGDSISCAASDAFASIYDCPGYRLPTEAEWEYAARAGTTTGTYNGDPDVEECEPSATLTSIAWFCGNGDSGPYSVGSLAANGWGLHDMLGSVLEWCHDWYEPDLGLGPVTDPEGPEAGTGRTMRGGSWIAHARFVRAAVRDDATGGSSLFWYGFRAARTLP